MLRSPINAHLWWCVCVFQCVCGAGIERPTEDPLLSYPSPTDLQYSELGPKEVRVRWTGPSHHVRQYRVVFHSSEGQSPQEVSLSVTLKPDLCFGFFCVPHVFIFCFLQVVVNGSVSTVMLTGLSSQTQYHISIFPVYEDNVGSPLRGIFTTGECANTQQLGQYDFFIT